MRIERSTWGLLMAGIGLASACGCSGGAAGPVRVEERGWRSPAGIGGVQLLTEHYDIRTTSQDTVLREYLPEFMESAYREYAKVVPAEGAGGERLVVYVFGRRTEWSLFTKQFVPAQAQTYMYILSGGYMDQATATAVTWDIKRDYTLGLLAHEGLHQYLARHRPGRIPPWLNEGLAAQFEDFELDGARPIFRPERNLLRKNSLREAISLPDGFVPIERLLAMDAGDAVTKTGQPARGYYAQVWATVLFLRTSSEYRSGFERLLADAGTERLRTNVMAYRAATPSAAGMSDGEVVFRHYISEDLTDFGDAFKAYARGLVY